MFNLRVDQSLTHVGENGVKRRLGITRVSNAQGFCPAKVLSGCDTPPFFQSRPLFFGGKIHHNRGVELPMLNWALGFEHSAQLQKALLLLSAEKKALHDHSAINLFLDSYTHHESGSWGLLAGVNGFTDAMGLVDDVINPIVTGYASLEMLRPLLSATGKRYMYSRARIQMGPTPSNHTGPVRDSNARLRLWQENWRDLEWLIMDRCGKTSRLEVQKDLRDGSELNALKALSYGKHGLVDAIIVGEDALLTRPVLNQYYREHDLSGQSLQKKELREKFNSQYTSLDKVTAWAQEKGLLKGFKEFDSRSVSSTPVNLYRSVTEKKPEDTPEDKNGEASSEKEAQEPKDKLTQLIQKLAAAVKELGSKDSPNSSKGKEEKKLGVYVYTEEKKAEKIKELPRTLELKDKDTRGRIELENLPSGLTSLLYRDSLYFPQSFDVETGKGFQDQLQKLFDKRRRLLAQGQTPSNIVIVENSPGGSSIVTEKLKSLIESHDSPIDVIVQGWGVSGGSKLVSMVHPEKGNRFATPNATILLHQTRGGIGLEPSNRAIESNKGMNYSCSGYIALIAERSGRPLEEVEKDFSIDFWLNPVEAILYGSKGLIDGILVGTDEVLTRDAVMAFVVERFGNNFDAAQNYINEKFAERRQGINPAYPETHREVDQDPLANPLAVITTLKRSGKAKKLSDLDRFRKSLPDKPGQPGTTMDILTVLTPKEKEKGQ